LEKYFMYILDPDTFDVIDEVGYEYICKYGLIDTSSSMLMSATMVICFLKFSILR
jgi:hypothetical protein